ncbi:MAG: hypothetical protein WB677_27395 [Xanthobacteraceae bacterium]
MIRNIILIAALCLASVANAQTVHCSNPKDAEEARLCRESGMLPQPSCALQEAHWDSKHQTWRMHCVGQAGLLQPQPQPQAQPQQSAQSATNPFAGLPVETREQTQQRHYCETLMAAGDNGISAKFFESVKQGHPDCFLARAVLLHTVAPLIEQGACFPELLPTVQKIRAFVTTQCKGQWEDLR